jgi:hypothetical protein
MKNVFGLLLLIIMSSECMAQQRTAAETFSQLGTRLDAAQQALGGWSAGQTGAGTIENTVKILESIVVDFRGNPWVQVKGFKIKIGFPPSIDIDVEVPTSPRPSDSPR